MAALHINSGVAVHYRQRYRLQSKIMTTVLGLDPAIFPCMGIWLKRFATSEGRTFRRVLYPNIPSAKNAEKGVEALDKALHATPGPKIVFGHSMGSQVASKWLREKAHTSDIPHDEVTFLLCGNPERKYGGALCVQTTPKYMGMTVQPTYGGPGIPFNVPYAVTDYARQYDWWADSPTVQNPSSEAVKNASQTIHCNYFTVGLNDPDVRTFTEGNITYKFKPTILNNPPLQAIIEQSYRRPWS